jgi:hypothetical protein
VITAPDRIPEPDFIDSALRTKGTTGSTPRLRRPGKPTCESTSSDTGEEGSWTPGASPVIPPQPDNPISDGLGTTRSRGVQTP